MSREKSYLEKQTTRRAEKKKPQIGEGATDSRMAKIGFKAYLRQIEEEELFDEEDDLFEEEKILPSDENGIYEIYQDFLGENDDIPAEAKKKDTLDDSVDFIMDEMEVWLEKKGYKRSDIEEWMDTDAGDDLFDIIYNGLT